MEQNESLKLQWEGYRAFESGDYEASLSFYKRAYRHTPRDANLVVNLAFSLYLLRRYDEASEYYRAVTHLCPENWAGHAGLGNCYVQLHRFEDAIESLTKAIELQPDEAGCYAQLAQSYSNLRQYDDAADVLAAASRRSLRNPWLLVQHAVIAMGQGRDEAAFAYYSQAMSEGAINISVRRNFAKVALRLERFKEAKEALDQILLERPEDKTALSYLITAEFGLGNSVSALSAMRRALKDDPETFQRILTEGKRKAEEGLPTDVLSSEAKREADESWATIIEASKATPQPKPRWTLKRRR